MHTRIIPAFAAIAALATFTSCEALMGNLNPLGGGGGGAGQAMVDSMKDQPAMNMMQLPPDAAVGTWWEMDMGGMKQKTSVVAEMDGKLVVESLMDAGGEMVVQACLVDPSVDLMAEVKPGQKMNSNVTAAWIGVEGEKPVDRKVMDPMTMPEPTGGEAPAVEMEQGMESVTLAGKTFDAEWTEVAGSKTWMAKGTGFILKSMYQGSTNMELAGWGTDAKPALKWEE